MRGPFDDAIEAQQGAAVGEPPKAGAEEERRRPPGGKPLVRLLQLLEAAGYEDATEAVVEAAFRNGSRAAFDERRASFSAAPDRSEAPRGRRRRASSSSSRAAGDAPEALVGEEVAEAYLEADQTLGGPPGPGPQWQSLGPTTIPNGQTYGTSRVNVSGRIAAIAVDPHTPAHVLAGAANGGVWESTNGGASWAPRTDYAPTLAVGAIAFDPSNPATVYCGTGEGNWWAWLGAGVLRSTNGGTTWTTLCTAPFVGQGFYDLLVDPGNGQHLVAATTGGVYVSTNGGVTWTRRRAARTWSLAMGQSGRPRAEILAASADGLWRSTNGGTSWTAITLPGTPGAFDRLAVALTPANPNVGYAWGASGATAYFWRRSAGAWHSVPPPPGVNTGQAWYDWYCEASPDVATQVYLGAIEVYRGDLSGTTWTWRNLSNKGATGDSIHPDQHALAFEPGNPNVVYAGCDGGLFKSPNRGVNWQSCNNGLVISEFEYLAQNVGSSRWLVGGTQDNGTERWTGSPVFDHVADGDGGDCGVNRTNPAVVFHTYYGMSPERSTTNGDWASWTYIPPPVPPGEGSLFYPPFEASATNGDTVAIGGDALYVSRNNGAAWTRLAYPSAARSSAMFVPTADRVYAGTTDGRVFVTQWNGVTWTAPSALTTPRAGANVSDLFVDPTNLNRMWATYTTIGGGRVFRSDDGGAHWTDRTTAALPALPLNAVEVDPWNANRVWVAADRGVYQSLDAGASWTDYSNALPNAYVGDLLLHPHARVLRAGTRNRGIWQIPVDGWLTTPICGVQWTGQLAGNASARWFTFNWPATWHVIWTVMPTNPRPGSPQVTWKTQVERASAEFATYWITVTNLTPDPLAFEGRYCILSRY